MNKLDGVDKFLNEFNFNSINTNIFYNNLNNMYKSYCSFSKIHNIEPLEEYEFLYKCINSNLDSEIKFKINKLFETRILIHEFIENKLNKNVLGYKIPLSYILSKISDYNNNQIKLNPDLLISNIYEMFLSDGLYIYNFSFK